MTPPFALPPLDTLLIAGRAVFLLFSFVIASITFTAWRRAAQTQTQQVLAHTDLVLQRLADLEARVDATRHSISELGDRVDRPRQHVAATSGSGGYQVAIRLAKTGASREDLVSGCGLSPGEADLVQRLHGPSSAGYVTNGGAPTAAAGAR